MSAHVAIDQAALQEINLGQHFRVTAQGLVVVGNPSFDAFDALGETFRTLDRSLQFAIGDFFREVEDRFHERSSQILDHTGWSESTLNAYRWTSRHVLPDVRRMDVLTYSHHQAVAKLPPAQQKQWLDRAASPPVDDDTTSKPWSVSRLKQELKHADVASPTRTFGIWVQCESESDQDALARQLENLGRSKYKRTFRAKAGEE